MPPSYKKACITTTTYLDDDDHISDDDHHHRHHGNHRHHINDRPNACVHLDSCLHHACVSCTCARLLPSPYSAVHEVLVPAAVLQIHPARTATALSLPFVTWLLVRRGGPHRGAFAVSWLFAPTFPLGGRARSRAGRKVGVLAGLRLQFLGFGSYWG